MTELFVTGIIVSTRKHW